MITSYNHFLCLLKDKEDIGEREGSMKGREVDHDKGIAVCSQCLKLHQVLTSHTA